MKSYILYTIWHTRIKWVIRIHNELWKMCLVLLLILLAIGIEYADNNNNNNNGKVHGNIMYSVFREQRFIKKPMHYEPMKLRSFLFAFLKKAKKKIILRNVFRTHRLGNTAFFQIFFKILKIEISFR